LSIGLVTSEVAPETLDEMIKQADNLMYEVKESTKDSIAQKVIGA
jgi:PleD family two-component response regulator